MTSFNTSPRYISVFPVHLNLTKENTIQIRQELTAHVEQNSPTGIVFELSQVNQIDSAGLRTLISLRETMMKSGVTIALSGLTGRIYELIRGAGLNRFFKIAADSDAARDLLLQ